MTTWLEFVLFNVAGSVCLAFVAMWVSRRMQRPALAHTLWLLVLLKLVTPPLVEIERVPRIGSFVSSHEGSKTTAMLQTLPAGSKPQEPQALGSMLPSSYGEAQRGSNAIVPAATGSPSEPIVAHQGARGASAVELLFWTALAGAALLLSLTLARTMRFRQRLRREPEAPEEMQIRARELARILGVSRLPKIRVVSQRISPSLWPRLWSCEILLPAHLLPRLTADERDMLIAHELAHVRRRDHWIRPFEQLIVALYWWNPVAWWARRHLRAEEEKSCDALVLEKLPRRARAYAEGILKTIEFLATKRRAIPALATGAGDANRLEERMKTILSAKARRRDSLWLRGLFVAPAAVALLVAPAWVGDSAGVGKPGGTEKQASETVQIHREELLLQKELREIETRHMQVRMQIEEAMQKREQLRLREELERLEEEGLQEEAEALRQQIAQAEWEAAFRREQVQFELQHGQKREALEFQLQELSLQRDELLVQGDEAKAAELFERAQQIEYQIMRLELEAMRSELERSRKRLEQSKQELDTLSKP